MTCARLARAIIVVLLIVGIPLAASRPSTLQFRLAAMTTHQAFSIVGWEAHAIAGAIGRELVPPVVPPGETERVARVRAYFALMSDIDRARRDRDAEFSRPVEVRDTALLTGLEERVRALEERARADRPVVESIIAAQLTESLRELGLRPQTLVTGRGDGWPIPGLSFFPHIFFRFEQLPRNLVVAPRDRIAIIGSVLVDPHLTAEDIEGLESRVDGHGVNSLVTQIGGFATYPSMIPDTDSLERDLDVIVHEWLHHYLAFRPLGRAYFGDYEMRSINEIVADMVGGEVGEYAYERYYRARPPSNPAPPARVAAPSTGARPDFGTEMRRIRQHVEQLLAAGRVEEAEQYMREQRDYLNQIGFRVRRLNTAYLAFFGSYSGSANPNEKLIRRVRAQSGSLAEFISKVEQISSPADLRRLAGEPSS